VWNNLSWASKPNEWVLTTYKDVENLTTLWRAIPGMWTKKEEVAEWLTQVSQ
jgi:hypothetical protein